MTEIKHYQDEIAALQEQVRALAGDGAVLKNAVEQCKEFFKAWVLNRISPYNGAYLNALCAHAIEETPATDATIREIRAQAIELLADRRDAAAALAKSEGDERFAMSFYDEAARTRMFAARIRAGDQP